MKPIVLKEGHWSKSGTNGASVFLRLGSGRTPRNYTELKGRRGNGWNGLATELSLSTREKLGLRQGHTGSTLEGYGAFTGGIAPESQIASSNLQQRYPQIYCTVLFRSTVILSNPIFNQVRSIENNSLFFKKMHTSRETYKKVCNHNQGQVH